MNLYSFPFYASKSEQFGFNSDWHLFSAANRFLPFMIRKPADGQLIDCVKVLDLSGGLVHLVQPEDLNYRMYSDGIMDFIFYYAGIVQGMGLPCGKYYLQIGEFFSEVFTVADVSNMLMVEWQNKNNIGSSLIYQNGFFQRLYLDTAILEPKYKVDQEGEEDGFEVFHPTFTKLSKQLAIQTELIPEFLVDALAALPLHDQVTFGRYQEAKAIETDVDWLVSGVLGTVEIKFNEAEFAVSKICAEPLALVEVDQEGYVPKSWVCNGEPDPTPYWQKTGVYSCVTEDGKNTGAANVEEKDVNPNSPSYNQTRTVAVANDSRCPVPVTQTYRSAEISEIVFRDNCGEGYYGGAVTYTLPEGHVVSLASQTEADADAMAFFNSTKQQYANEHGACEEDTTGAVSGCPNMGDPYCYDAQGIQYLADIDYYTLEDGTRCARYICNPGGGGIVN